MNNGKLKTIGASLFLDIPLLAGCGGGASGGDTQITIWVGDESQEFYQTVCNEYIAAHPDFGFTIKTVGTDLGSIAGTILKDSSACGDIYSVAHDNIGKLVQHGDAKPFYVKTGEGADEFIGNQLIAQLEADNSDAFKSVCKSNFEVYSGEGSATETRQYYAGVPYISQALFLMYNKKYVSDEQAKTFEGLKEAAAAAEAAKGEGAKVKAVTVTGTDTFNMSFGFLAKSEAVNPETGNHESSLQLYEDFDKAKTYVQGDDMVATYKWLQHYRADAHGLAWATGAGFDGDMREETVLSVIGGSWKFNNVVDAIGRSNVGLAKIPTYTITENDAFGTCGAGTVYRGGTFADCKVLMINSHSAPNKYEAILEIVKYLSSKEIQKRSFAECLNTPAYQGFGDEIDAIRQEYGLDQLTCDLAKAQADMIPYGIPQPINTALLNNFFYSSGADSVLKGLVDNQGGNLSTDAAIQKELYTVNYIWIWGRKPKSYPSSFPADPNKNK